MNFVLYKNIPWDNTYKHTMDFRIFSGGFSENVRSAYFQDKIYADLSVNGRAVLYDNQRYRIEGAKDTLVSNGVNYCIFTTDESTIKMYAFITNIEYLAQDTSIVTLEIDVFQTYLSGFVTEPPS